METINTLLVDYTRFDLTALFIVGIASFFSLIVLLIILSVLKRLIEKEQKPDSDPTYKIALLKGLRRFLYFFTVYVFLRVIQDHEYHEYPYTVIVTGVQLLILYSGISLGIFKFLKVIEKRKTESAVDPPLIKSLATISRKNTNMSILFLLIVLFSRQIRGAFPVELQSSGWMVTLVALSSVFLTLALLFAIRRILPQVVIFLEVKNVDPMLMNFANALSNPLKMLIFGLFLLSMKTVLVKPDFIVTASRMLIEFFFSAAALLFLHSFIQSILVRLSKYAEEESNSIDRTLIEMTRMIVRIVFIFFAVLLVTKIILNKPLTTLMAGLGIGGLAVALAAQDTLKNFFGSIMIMTDKPFKIGERIVADGTDGTVESIGFRSTRIRTLTGHQVIMPNDKVAQAAIENIGRRPSIRRLTNITITYDTPPDKVERALAIIRGILDNHEGMLPDFPPRVHFNEFNADSLNILVLYWYAPPDYWDFLQFSEQVNLSIMKQFAAEGIEFAFPTNTTYLEQADGKSIALSVTDPREKI